MRIALLLVVAAVVVGFLLSRSRGLAVVSGAPGAPAVVTPAEPASAAPSASAGGVSTLATPTLKTPLVITPVAIKKPSSKAQPLASAKPDN